MRPIADITDRLPGRLGPDALLLLFDAECVLCSHWVRFVIPRDPEGRILMASVQSATGREVLAASGLPTDRFDTMLFVDGGRVHAKSGAFLRLVRHLRAPWPILAAGAVVPRWLRDWAYDRVARNRYRIFGRHAACHVPVPEARERFLG